MVKQASLELHKSKFEDPRFANSCFNIQNKILVSAAPSRTNQAFEAKTKAVPSRILLNLKDLKCFDAVERQFEQQGVIFDNCIAIQPSNPAFPTQSSSVVLMGGPKSGLLEATFERPVQFVSAFVTSSQRLVLSAYNSDRQLLVQTLLPEANLAYSDSALPPNTLLSVSAKDIHSVTFCAFDGQFTISDFSFSF